MSLAETVVRASLKSDDAFKRTLNEVLRKLKMTIKDLSKRSGVPESTLYKISSGERADLRISTLRKIIEALKKAEGVEERDFIAIIATRPILDAIARKSVVVSGREIMIKEYSAATTEEAIIAARMAERAGAKALVCAPILGSIIERLVDVPIVTIHPDEPALLKAAEVAARKIIG